jgi:hypothetical protein
MAVRTVTSVRHNPEGSVIAVCNAEERWSPRLVADAIEDIEQRNQPYRALVPPAPPAAVFVVHESGGPYLRTAPDMSLGNNLSRMAECAEQVLRRPVRRNIATVGAAERSRLADAIRQLQNRFPEGDPITWWFMQDFIHANSAVHGGAQFLPWHRTLINHFEKLLQELDPDLALHYWDWTTDPRCSPDGIGGSVDLMTSEFMGMPRDEMGAPFDSFYTDAKARNRDSDESRWPNPLSRTERASLPPPPITRLMPSDGKTPREVTVADLDPNYPNGPKPGPEEDATVHSDTHVVRESFFHPRDNQFERFWRDVERSHGWAHQYVGGTLVNLHLSFRDPFAFLLHSNVDRLWASWQLSGNGVRHDEVSWRLESGDTYGNLPYGGPLAYLPSEIGETQDHYDNRLISASAEAQRELTAEFKPWNGESIVGKEKVLPWARPGEDEQITALDTALVRPALYDTYVDNLCASWPAMLLGRSLDDGDIIEATVQLNAAGVDSDSVEIVLTTPQRIVWWKAIEVPDGGLISTDGNTHETRVTVKRAALDGGQLAFWKAKAFWVVFTKRFLMYRLADLGWLPAQTRVTFDWQRD